MRDSASQFIDNVTFDDIAIGQSARYTPPTSKAYYESPKWVPILMAVFIGLGAGTDGPLREFTQDATTLVNLFAGLPSPAKDAALKVVSSTEVFLLAESLGGVESLIGYPSEITHASVRGTELEVPDNLVRLSVGIEGVDDLVADILQALDK